MPRAIWTKLQADPNGTWTRHEGTPPFAVPLTGGLSYDVHTDAGESFVLVPDVVATQPAVIIGVPSISGTAEPGNTLTAAPTGATGTEPINVSWQWLRNGAEIAGATTASYLLTEIDAGTDIAVRQTVTNATGSDSATSSAVSIQAVSTVAALSNLLISDQSGTGEVMLTYVIDRDSVVAGVLTRSPTAPSAAQILAGQDHLGAPAESVLNDTWTQSGNESLPDIALGLVSDTFYLHVLPLGGGDADITSSNGFTLETLAPSITSAENSEAGDQIILQFSEILAGTTNPGDWTVFADGTQITISDVTLTGPSVDLTLASAITAGQTVTLDYNGTGLTDTVANSLEPVTALPVTNTVQGAFTENSVYVPASAYLIASNSLPTDAKSLLYFASVTVDPSVSSPAAMLNWNGIDGGFYARWTTAGVTGARVKLQHGSLSASGTQLPISSGTRYHFLLSAWIDDTLNEVNMRGAFLDFSTGTWDLSFIVNRPADAGDTFLLGPDVAHIFARSGSLTNNFTGTVNRVALWSGAADAPIADVTQSSVRDLFGDASQIVDPTLSRGAFGQPLIDFTGTAADYNAGTHSGSLPSFTPTGVFG